MTESQRAFRRSVRVGEGPILALSSLLAFAVLAVSVLSLGSVTALFLGGRPRADLPWAYAAAAVFGVVGSSLVAWASERVSRIREALFIFVAFACVLFMGFLLVDDLPSSFLFVLYPLCTGLSALTTVQAFAIISDCLDADQARRLYPLIGAGGTLGAVMGGAAMALCGPALGVRSLLLLSAVLLIALCGVARRLMATHVRETAASLRPSRSIRVRTPLGRTFERSLGLLLDDDLVRLFALTQVALMLASTLLKYEFETALQGRLTVEHITVFLGLFNLGSNAAVLLVQTLLERRLIARYGFSAGLMSVPTVLALFVPFLLFVPGLFAIALLRLVEQVARFSIARTAEDLVLLPLSSIKRRRAKTLVTGALVPFAVLSASLLIALLGPEAHALRITLAWLAGACAVALVARMRAPYLERLRGSLSETRAPLLSSGFQVGLPDGRGLREAVDLALGSPDPKRLLFGLGMATDAGVSIETERFEVLFGHDDGRVREAAFLAAERLGSAELTSALLAAFEAERDVHARLACARALCKHMPDERLDELRPMLEDESPVIRAAALARRYAARRDDSTAFTRLSTGSDRDRQGVALALAEVSLPMQGSLLGGLLRDANLEVRRAALGAAAQNYEPLHLPHVLAALDQPTLGRRAADVLKAWPSHVSVPALSSAVREASTRQRRRVALSALGRLAHASAIEALFSFVSHEADDVRQGALLGLTRQAVRGGDLKAGHGALEAAALGEQRRLEAFELCAARLASEGLPAVRLVAAKKELSLSAERAEERLFGWLSLIYPRDEMLRCARALGGKDPKARAFALEVLEQRLSATLRREIMPYLRATRDERARLAEQALGLPRRASASAALKTGTDPLQGWLAFYLGYRKELGPEDPPMTVLETMFALRNVELFSQLSSDELRAVAELAETTRFATGSVIIREREPGDALFILLRGEVEVSRDGKSVAVLSDGECFGELALLDRGIRSATIAARADCELARIRAEDFHDLLDEAPSIARAMLQILARRTTSLLDRRSA